ncbi:hypothetical protein HJC99_06330 [Candidatus Saccharibacteria bacterium]|nr:hypothetical protein [Candidatus Saccharibacteria bacterium]
MLIWSASIVRFVPRFSDFDRQKWTFLGCDTRDEKAIPEVGLRLLPTEQPTDEKFVDLWYNTAHNSVMVVAAGGRWVTGDGFCHSSDYLGCANNNVREAVRRAKLFELVPSV